MSSTKRAARRAVRVACPKCAEVEGMAWIDNQWQPCPDCQQGVVEVDPCETLFPWLSGSPSLQEMCRRLDALVQKADSDAEKARGRDGYNVARTRGQTLADVRDALLYHIGQRAECRRAGR